MIELISIICSLVVCVFTPIEVERIRGGWVNKRYAGDRDKFLTAYRRQLSMLTWFGIGFFPVMLLLAFVETNGVEKIVKVVAGFIWLAVAVICYVSRRRLPQPGVAAAP